MPRIAAIVLAAGESRRFGTENKLLAPIEGMPMILRIVQAVLAAKARPVIVVTGHEARTVADLLTGLPVSIREASDYATGLSASLKAGIAAIPEGCDGVLICLGDMPWVNAATLDKLVDGFDPAGGWAAAVPVHGGEWGNPVLLGRELFAAIADLSGDRGARAMLAAARDRVMEVAVDDPGVLRDVDRPDALVYPLADGIDRSRP
jgi:molybdenum cofactor cytidylyltransferase